MSFWKKKKKPEKLTKKVESKTQGEPLKDLQFATRAIHSDGKIENTPDVSPPLHLSTTYIRPNDDGLAYGRIDQMTRRRCEAVLGDLEGGACLLYSSGLAAVMALLYLVQPKRVWIEKGYFMTHGVIRMFGERPGENDLPIMTVETISLSKTEARPFKKGDLILLETPNNPTCEIFDIEQISKEAHELGAVVAVDSTFATPVLQRPLALGADVVLHSCTKFLGGHSDLTVGALITNNFGFIPKLHRQRGYLGSIPGNLECLLLLRSLRTLVIRVKRHSRTAEKVALFLSTHPKVTTVWHPSIPSHPGHELAQKQMSGPPACFSFELKSQQEAITLPSTLQLFKNATSLGGVESLIDHRYAYDQSAPPTLLRVSIGLESAKDLIADLTQALNVLPETEK